MFHILQQPISKSKERFESPSNDRPKKQKTKTKSIDSDTSSKSETQSPRREPSPNQSPSPNINRKIKSEKESDSRGPSPTSRFSRPSTRASSSKKSRQLLAEGTKRENKIETAIASSERSTYKTHSKSFENKSEKPAKYSTSARKNSPKGKKSQRKGPKQPHSVNNNFNSLVYLLSLKMHLFKPDIEAMNCLSMHIICIYF